MKKTSPTLVASIPSIDFGSLLQALELQNASGTLACRDLWLRMNEGRIVRSSGDLGTLEECARETVALLLEETGELAFWPAAPVTSSREQRPATAILLEVCRERDELRGAA